MRKRACGHLACAAHAVRMCSRVQWVKGVDKPSHTSALMGASHAQHTLRAIVLVLTGSADSNNPKAKAEAALCARQARRLQQRASALQL